MGLGSRFATFLRREQRMHAVWPPVASAVDVGDYGAFDDGVFVRLGNISEFGLAITTRPTSALATLRLASNGVTVTRLQAGVPVPRITATAGARAEVKVHFAHKYSFLMHATGIEAHEMTAAESAASQLSMCSGWKRGFWGWKVVAKRYLASQLILLASQEARTDFSFHGEASLLADYDGDAALRAGVEHQANKALALELTAGRGAIGLELFRVGRHGHAVTRGPGDHGASGEADIVPEDDWDAELPHDWS